jgi:hypothetical protein
MPVVLGCKKPQSISRILGSDRLRTGAAYHTSVISL